MNFAAIKDRDARRAVQVMARGGLVNVISVSNESNRRAISAVQAYKNGAGPAPSLASVSDPALRTVLAGIIGEVK